VAWISVHESIDGPKLRRLYKTLQCSKFEATGILVFLWFWGLNNADRNGRIIDADREDVERNLYGVGTKCKIDPVQIVDALITPGWIDETDDGIFLHDWDTWQAQWYNAMDRRAKESERKRESRALKKAAPFPYENAGVQPSEPDQAQMKIPLESYQGSTTGAADREDKPVAPRNGSINYSVSFEEFWSAYPRHDEKGSAFKKYKARIKDGFTDEQLLTAAKNYALQCKRARTEKQFIKLGKTFLGDALPFMDHLPRKEPDVIAEATYDVNPFEEWGGDDK